jgi:hypothetical protein
VELDKLLGDSMGQAVSYRTKGNMAFARALGDFKPYDA